MCKYCENPDGHLPACPMTSKDVAAAVAEWDAGFSDGLGPIPYPEDSSATYKLGWGVGYHIASEHEEP